MFKILSRIVETPVSHRDPIALADSAADSVTTLPAGHLAAGHLATSSASSNSSASSSAISIRRCADAPRKWARSAIDRVVLPICQHLGLLNLCRSLFDRRALTVVMFHRILPLDSDAYRHSEQEYAISTDAFERCLAFFARHYNVVSLTAVERAAAGGERLAPHPLLITFDDGWRDNLVHAEPILKRHRMKATLFINVDAVNQSERRWWQDALVDVVQHDPAAAEAVGLPSDLFRAISVLLKMPADRRMAAISSGKAWVPGERQMMTPDDVRLLDPTVWDVGSHGMSHAPLTEVADPAHELVASGAALSGWLRSPVRSFSFPHGRHSPAILALARRTYSLTFTSDPVLTPTGRANPGLIGRIHLPLAACADDRTLARFLWIRRRKVLDIGAAVVPAMPTPVSKVCASRRFSVVIPLYNKAPHIEASLASALADRERVGEVIVVDDGSTDNGAALAERNGDPRVRVIRQPNGGVSRARNVGIEASRGEWVAFLDADDIWCDGYIARLDALASEFPDCSMLATRYLLADEAGRRRAPDGDWTLPDNASVRIADYFSLMSRGHVCCTISTAVRRSLLEEKGLRFPEGEQLGEDLDFFFRVAEHTPLALAPEPLAIYVDSNQVERLSHRRSANPIAPFLQRMEARLDAGNIAPALRAGVERYIATKYELAVLTAKSEGRRSVAISLLRHRLLRARRARWLALLACVLMPRRLSTRLVNR